MKTTDLKRTGICKRYNLCENKDKCLLFVSGYGCLEQKIMGYELSENMNAENVVKALKMAIRNRITHLPLIHHSDRGLQYCSEIYQKVLE